MTFWHRIPTVLLTGITIVLGVLLATVLLLFGVAELLHPEVPASYLALNTRICVMMILTGLVSIYALFRPYSGGFLLCICAVVLGFIFGGFFRNPITSVVLLLGVLSVIRGRLSRRTPPTDRDQAS